MEIYNQEHDFKRYCGNPQKIICVFFVPRSGSTFLATEMQKTGKLGFPLEYFSVPNMARLSERMPGLSIKNVWPIIERRTSPNGVFSFGWNSNYGPLDVLKPDFSIFVDRFDHEAQAASYVTASKNGEWITETPGAYNATRKEIEDAKITLEAVRTNTLKMVGDNYRTVHYEDLVEDPQSIIDGLLFDIMGEDDIDLEDEIKEEEDIEDPTDS